MSIELTITLLTVLALTLYTVRSQRAIGNKVSEAIRINNELLRRFNSREKSITREVEKVRDQLNLLNLSIPGINESDFKYVLSLTSHPARFSALAQVLPLLRYQVLAPEKILLNIAHEDLKSLPTAVTELAKSGFVTINEVEDLGPGKKLIPTLAQYPELPIIVIDDDLYLSPDLTLQLMLEHKLYPGSIIASRVHHITYNEDGSMKPFSAWEKASEDFDGPALDLLATSGAGTLFPPHVLHDDALDVNRYKELSFHTDDLWWYFQAQRKGTTVRRLPGHRPLEFVPESQEDGLWRTGNKDRNEENLQKLIKEIGAVHGNK